MEPAGQGGPTTTESDRSGLELEDYVVNISKTKTDGLYGN